jgi:hypothetical protein
VAAVISEVFMIGFGIAMTPAGVFDSRLRRSIGLAVVSGVAMILMALLTKPLTPFLSAPLALSTYAGVLWLTGGVDKNQLASVWKAVGGRFSRSAS